MTPEEAAERNRSRCKAYYAAHREEQMARARQYYARNREELRARARYYYELHREETKTRKRKWRDSHREEAREYHRRYYIQHRERILAKYSTPEYLAHRRDVRKQRKIRIVSENLARIKQSLIDNKETNARRARQVNIAKGLAQMGEFVPHHKKFRDPND
jgi:hypothetical protein